MDYIKVNSSLDSVGLTATFSSALAKNGISCNIVSGYYRDHIFVNINDKNKAVNILKIFLLNLMKFESTIFGATGLIGGLLLKLLIDDSQFLKGSK